MAFGLAASVAAALATPGDASELIFLLPLTLTAGAILLCGVRVDAATRLLHESALEQARLAVRAEQGASEAQLAALQAQLSPHFLFNTLNTVAALVRTRPLAAERTVENLADVLRSTLTRSSTALQPLREEIEFLRAYLGIEQERMGERLKVIWSIAPETLDASVPPFTLQPLVENALKHAIGNRLSGGTLRICAERADASLVLRVEDDGDGFPTGWREGVGLKNLHHRLAAFYRGRALLQVQNGEQGAKLTVTLPLDPA
jgi:LytS/YehU family sensor histidine kinase